jgi:hypothetical protein
MKIFAGPRTARGADAVALQRRLQCISQEQSDVFPQPSVTAAKIVAAQLDDGMVAAVLATVELTSIEALAVCFLLKHCSRMCR